MANNTHKKSKIQQKLAVEIEQNLPNVKTIQSLSVCSHG